MFVFVRFPILPSSA